MSEDKWWGKTEEKKSSKETIEEMMDNTEMMRIKREEEMAEAQHEAELSRLKDETLGTKTGDSASVNQGTPKVQANNGRFGWMTDDPGYLFLTIIVFLGILGALTASALTPSVDEDWENTDGIVLEGTEWIEKDDSYEDCAYDDYYDEYYDCYWIYEYSCYADVYYNYSIQGVEYISEDDLYLGTWDDYCLEIVESETLPLNSTVEVWYKIDENEISQLESPDDLGGLFSFIGLCCLLPILLTLLFFMYFDGNNSQYDETGGAEGDIQVHHHHHGGGALFGGVYYGTPWHRRPWFHRRRSRRITRRRSSGGRSRSSGGRSRSSGGGSRSSGGRSRRSGGRSRSSGRGRRSR